MISRRTRIAAALITPIAAISLAACSKGPQGPGKTGYISCAINNNAFNTFKVTLKDGKPIVTNYWEGSTVYSDQDPNKPYKEQFKEAAALEDGEGLYVTSEETGNASLTVFTDENGVYVQATDDDEIARNSTIVAFVQDGEIGVDLSGSSDGAAMPVADFVGDYEFVDADTPDAQLPEGFEQVRRDGFDVIKSTDGPNGSSIVARTHNSGDLLSVTTCRIDFGREFNS